MITQTVRLRRVYFISPHIYFTTYPPRTKGVRTARHTQRGQADRSRASDGDTDNARRFDRGVNAARQIGTAPRGRSLSSRKRAPPGFATDRRAFPARRRGRDRLTYARGFRIIEKIKRLRDRGAQAPESRGSAVRIRRNGHYRIRAYGRASRVTCPRAEP